MPKISIVIPAYNVGDYLQECLDSVRNQTFSDIEAIVVNDASPDNVGEVAAQAAAQDARIRVVTNNPNMGTHRTRMAGVENASGEYTFFLDGDDALKPDMCEQLAAEIDKHPVDVLHFGLTVVAANDLLENERQAFETFNNTPTPDSTGEDIVRDIFDETRGYKVDWRVTQRLYKTSVLKEAFNAMTRDRLGRSQDGYECFVVSAFANSYHSFKECRGYVYYYGRGISGTNMIDAAKYARYCGHFKADFDAAYEFADEQHSDMLHACAQGFQRKATEILANDWKVRVPEAEKVEAAKQMEAVFGPAITGRELYRFVRDDAYALLSDNQILPHDADLNSWFSIANAISMPTDQISADTIRFHEMKRIATSHMANLIEKTRNTEAFQNYNKQNIRIFVTTHKNVNTFDSKIMQPVQVGPKNYRFPWAFHDDDGENISDRNPRYCELTTQYWAWKNIKADYYGFCHYRRYFDFSDTPHKENPYGEIMDNYVDAVTAKKYGLNDENIAKVVKQYDVITTPFGNLEKIIDKHGTPRALWEAAPLLHDDDLKRCYQILCAMYPDYKKDAQDFFNGNKACFCNMFIMKKEIFFDYCAWMFPILEAFDKNTDYSAYSKEALRTPGHLSERLLNIYLLHHKRIGSKWKFKELQCVHFTHPEPAETLQPVEVYDKPIVPVVFAADNNYVPQLTTTIYSAMKNASPDRYYDVTVLQRDIDWHNQQRMRDFFSQFTNMNLRFANVERLMSGYELSTNNEHISVETYYRFLIQQALPFYNKVLYLDSDIIIPGDIAKLYDTELGDTLLAAIHDIDFLGNLNVKHGKRMEYAKGILKMKNPYDYFQAGVLVLNTKAMREQYTIKQWLTYASNTAYIYNDQDVLNICCEGKVTYLPWEWNVVHDCGGRVGNLFVQAPNDMYDTYMQSRSNPQIIHYAGYQKPWVDPDCDYAPVYWDYARDTPFYEALLKRVVKANAPAAPDATHRQHERAVGENNPIRKIVDPLMPIGSKRRDAVKAIGRVIRGRH
jgi:lipopolysaccharide biosynthesis glycosyltransferase